MDSDHLYHRPGFPIIDEGGRKSAVLSAYHIEHVGALLGELEKTTLHALDFIRLGQLEKAASAMQVVRSHLALWGGELAVLGERLEP